MREMANGEWRMANAEWTRTPAVPPSPGSPRPSDGRGERGEGSPVHVYIERLVVDEALLSFGRGEVLRTAVEAELTRLLTEGGLRAVGDAVAAQQSGGNIRVTAQTTPAQMGRQIAQATYAALNMAEQAGSTPEPTRGMR